MAGSLSYRMKLGGKTIFSDYSGFLECGTSVIGDLQFSGTLRINGDLHGSIQTSDLLIVGEKATVQADINAGEVQIFGTVLGNIDCHGRVEICNGGYLQGEVRTPWLIIDEGGIFEGLSHSTAEPTHLVLPAL